MVSCEAHHYCPFWPCMSFPRRQLVHLLLLLTKAASLKPNTRPGSKCCQNIGHQGARAKEYPSFPSSCWDEIFWWEVHMELKGFFRAQFRSSVNHCRGIKAGAWYSWLREVQSTESARLPACQCPTHLLPSSVTQDPSPRSSAAAVGWVSPNGLPYEDKWLQKCPQATRLEYSSFSRWFQVIVDCWFNSQMGWDKNTTQEATKITSPKQVRRRC